MKILIAIAVVGATLAAAGGAVADPGKLEARMIPVASPQAPANKYAAPKHCVWPRISVHQEKVKLSLAGYHKIKYLGKKIFLPRCAKFLYFSACKGVNRYRLIVRYIKFQRYVIAQPQGGCYVIYKPGAFKR